MLKSLFIEATCNDMASKFQQCFTCACIYHTPRALRTGAPCDFHSVTPAISLTNARPRQHPTHHLIDEAEAVAHLAEADDVSHAG
jgi:hypothetical protein